MKNHILRFILACVLICTVILSLTGCSKEEKITYDNYSIGLNNDGYYNTLKNHSKEISYSGLKITVEDVLAWGNQQLNSESDTNITVDEYVKNYTKEVLAAIGVADKETVEIGDIVTLQLDFYLDGKQLNELYGENSYVVSEDSDSLIQDAIGHKKNDEYESKYTFDEKDESYPSKTATVKVKVLSVVYQDPVTEELVKKGLKEINKLIEDVTNVETLLTNIRPKLAEALLFDYLAHYVQNDESIKVPQEYIDYEIYRLKSRLEKIGYTYDEYLKTAKTTDEETIQQCEKFARENYVVMLTCQQNNIVVTDAELDEYFGESKETAVNVQGLPYMRLTLLRERGLTTLMQKVRFVGDDGKRIKVNVETETSKNETDKKTDQKNTKK